VTAVPHAPRLVPYPNTETWFLGVEPLAEGDCDYCPDPATVVVGGKAFTCPRHAGVAVAADAEEHGYGHVIDIEATVEPLAPFPLHEWVEVR
jgi:hypothetical protein